MVIDRENCIEVRIYLLEVQMPYKLTTFFVYSSGFPWKIVLPFEVGRGTKCMVKCRAQKK
jgi:hypothetical protein